MLKNLFKSLTALLICTMFTQNVVFMDAAEPWQLGFQDPATPIMEGIINFHNHILYIFRSNGGWHQPATFDLPFNGVDLTDR